MIRVVFFDLGRVLDRFDVSKISRQLKEFSPLSFRREKLLGGFYLNHRVV